MANYDIFNGDADGICALLQLRLAEPREATLVTGVKCDIDLVKKVDANASDSLTVLDISMEKNHSALAKVLATGAKVSYFDHHFAGEIPTDDNLSAYIDTDAETCTGLIVNNYLKGAFLPWAITAAFGDNLHTTATKAAAELNLSDNELAQLEELGTLLNYNGYGATVDDLYFAPDELFKKLLPYSSPFDFIAKDENFSILKEGYESDMANAKAIDADLATEHCALFKFPEASWSRQVSVRAPINRREGADELCRQFNTGGGRKAAAGINQLPHADIDNFKAAFQKQFNV